MAKRTVEELIQHREEQNRKARLRLARARDPKICVVEDVIRDLQHPWLASMIAPNEAAEYAIVVDALERIRDTLVSEAVKQ